MRVFKFEAFYFQIEMFTLNIVRMFHNMFFDRNLKKKFVNN